MHLDLSDEQVLLNAGIRVTAVRLLVWRKVRHGFQDTFSLADLESALPTVDRSTLFRTITLLADAHLLHGIDDGTGSQKLRLPSRRYPPLSGACPSDMPRLSSHLLPYRREDSSRSAAVRLRTGGNGICGEGRLSRLRQ